MATLFEVARAFSQVDLMALARQIVMNDAELILEENRAQLYRGEKPDGSDITPRYRFHWYAQWKYKMNTVPGFGTPDLFISGKLHDTLKLSTQTFMPYFDSPIASYPQIAQYEGIFGVSREFLVWYANQRFISQLVARINIIRRL